jgi:hypothetical protein
VQVLPRLLQPGGEKIWRERRRKRKNGVAGNFRSGVDVKQLRHRRVDVALSVFSDQRLIDTRARFRIRLVRFIKKAEKFCSYERAKLMRDRPLKSDV